MVEQDNGARWPRVTLVLALAWSLVAACGPASGGPSPTSTSAAPAAYYTSSPPPERANGFERLKGTVTDASTGKPLRDACVVIATGGSCQPSSPRTDSAGFWWIDLPAGIEWDFAWTKDGYQTEKRHILTRAGEEVIDIALTPAQ